MIVEEEIQDEYDSDESSSPIPSPRLTPNPSPRSTSADRPSFFKSLAHGTAPLSNVNKQTVALKNSIVPKIPITMNDDRVRINDMSARARQAFIQNKSPRRNSMKFHDRRAGGKKSKRRRKSKKSKRRKSKRRKFSKYILN